jgi:membrane protease YdiL (CAAX protease family)
MVNLEGKRSIFLFFVFIYLPSIALFLLSSSANLSNYISTTFYVILAAVCMVILAFIKSDDKYYENFTLRNLLSAVIVSVFMTVLSWGMSMSLAKPSLLLAMNNGLSIAPTSPSSASTFLLAAFVSGLVLAATSEELFKLVMFAEGKERWGKGYKIGRRSIPGVLFYVGMPVFFWALLHLILAYSDPVMVIPAFVNGILLIILLWKTHCILACIFAHWLYNASIVLITYFNGSSGVSNIPFFPDIFNGAYWSNNGWSYDLLLGIILAGAILFFLIPSLTKHR